MNREAQPTSGNASGRYVSAAVLFLAFIAGCSNPSTVQRIYFSPYPEPRTVAVPVFLNHSGSADMDMLAMTDAFYTELQAVKGIEVPAVNVTRAALAELGLEQVSSVDDVRALAEQLQTDGVIVGSVTRYDPYDPPELGMVVELYWQDADASEQAGPGAVDSRELALAGKEDQLRLSALDPMRPVQRVVQVFDADEEAVIGRLREYALEREGLSKPYGWERYKTRTNYLRFVSHEVIGELLMLEWQRREPWTLGEAGSSNPSSH